MSNSVLLIRHISIHFVIFRDFSKTQLRKQMGTFHQNLNPITGRSEWEARCDDYDYHQEVARSAFADMLHDNERNEKYLAALQKTIRKLHEQGKKANVLDIGTGTGLLSMMAVRSGADSLTACEAFMPMANCAERVIRDNGMSDRIRLIRKRSTDLKVGATGDMEERANVLVTEVFDTELIGEGAIEIFNHAHRELLTDDCVVIPHLATIWGQVVESPLVSAWNRPRVLANLDGDVLLKVPRSIRECNGECAVHDLQLSQLPSSQFNLLSPPLQVFEFDFGNSNGVAKKRRSAVKFTGNYMGLAHAIFFWWDIKMDADDEIILSCAPFWTHPDYEKPANANQSHIPSQNVIPWRDHWTQAIYHLPKPFTVCKGAENYLIGYHDEYSFWFDTRAPEENAIEMERLRCSCGFHLAYSRTRIGQMNHPIRTKRYLRVLEETINSNSVVLSISDGSLIGLSTRSLGAKKVYCLEPNQLSQNVMDKYIEENELDGIVVLKSLDDLDCPEEITHVIAEPYFITSILPWDNFYFGTLLGEIKEKLNETAQIMPMKATIFMVAVEFSDLHKIRTKLGNCQGFDHKAFDEMVETSSRLADANVEAQPLWEYPGIALSAKIPILTVDFKKFNDKITNTGTAEIQTSATCNGLALWVDWSLDGSDSEKCNISTGPNVPIEIGDYISWDMHVRQGVHLVDKPKHMKIGDNISWNVTFVPERGDIKFNFSLV